MPSKKDRAAAEALGLPYNKTDKTDDKPWQFKKGAPSANPNGRPKGAKGTLNKAVIDALLADFKKGGLEAIEKVRDKRPQDYLKVIASVLPKQVEVTVDRFEEMNEEALERAYLGLLEALNSRIEAGVSEGIARVEPEAREKLSPVLPSVH